MGVWGVTVVFFAVFAVFSFLRVYGSTGLRVDGFTALRGLRVYGIGLRVWGSVFRFQVPGFRFRVSFRVLFFLPFFFFKNVLKHPYS